MFPQPTRTNCVYGDSFDSEFSTQICWPQWGRKYFYNLLFGQFSVGVFCTFWRSFFRNASNTTQIFFSIIRAMSFWMFCAIIFASRTIAAFASTASIFCNTQIISIKRMPIFTMGLSSALRTQRFTSHCIFVLSNWFEVFWIDARPISTKVINYKTFWNRSNAKNIAQSMSHNSTPVVCIHRAIAVFVGKSWKWPTLLSAMRSLKVPQHSFETEAFHGA